MLWTIAAVAVILGADDKPEFYRIRAMAAGDRTNWISDSDGDFNDPNNWDNGVPGNAADFDPNGYFGSGGSASVDTSLDRTGSNHFSLFVERGYDGDIGSSGNPLLFPLLAPSDIQVIHRGTGSIYLGGESVGALNITVDSPNVDDAIVLSNTGAAGYLCVKEGKAVIASTGQAQIVTLSGPFAGLDLKAADSTEASPTKVTISAGFAEMRRDMASGNVWMVGGGRLDYLAGNINAAGYLVITHGTMNFEPSEEMTSGFVYLMGGRVFADASRYPIAFTELVRGPKLILADTPEGLSGSSVDLNLAKLYP